MEVITLKKELYDPELFDILSKILDEERRKSKEASTVDEALDHAEKAKRACELRQDISVDEKPTNGKKGNWLDTPMSDKDFWHDVIGVAGPVVAVVGTIAAAVIQTKSQEKIAKQNAENKLEMLKVLMNFEEDNLVDKRKVDIINGLGKV